MPQQNQQQTGGGLQMLSPGQQQPGAGAQQPGQQPYPGAPPPGSAPGAAGGLPPSGLQNQLASMQQYYSQVQGAQGGGGSVGFNVQQWQGQQNNQALAGGGVGVPGGASGQGGGMPGGQTNIQQLAKNLAQRYGLQLGRGELVDQNGNFLLTPEQLSGASGGSTTMGMAAAKMNYIAQAIAGEQNKQQQRQGIAAMSAGLGLVQSRGRGSLAAMQSGFYQSIADLYANQEHEAADFTFFIEEERFRIQLEMQRRAEKRAKKSARIGAILGIVGLALAIPTGGATLSMAGGLGQAGSTGWF